MSLKTTSSQDNIDTVPQVLPAQDVLLFLLVIVAGVLFAINMMPLWLPSMSYSVAGSEPKIYWFLARGSAIAAYWLLWLSVCMGVGITNKLVQTWPGVPPAYEIHQYTSLLGIAFSLFHGLILMGDKYMNFNLAQVLVPFASQNYKPAWVGFGQMAFYIWAVIVVSFYVKKRTGKKAWRLIHYLGFVCFMAVMAHGIMSGTDATTTWAKYLYWISGASVLFLVVYRILITMVPLETKTVKREPPASSTITRAE
jgi:predicted ferric reductase